MHITLDFAVIRFHNPTLDYKSQNVYVNLSLFIIEQF